MAKGSVVVTIHVTFLADFVLMNLAVNSVLLLVLVIDIALWVASFGSTRKTLISSNNISMLSQFKNHFQSMNFSKSDHVLITILLIIVRIIYIILKSDIIQCLSTIWKKSKNCILL